MDFSYVMHFRNVYIKILIHLYLDSEFLSKGGYKLNFQGGGTLPIPIPFLAYFFIINKKYHLRPETAFVPICICTKRHSMYVLFFFK